MSKEFNGKTAIISGAAGGIEPQPGGGRFVELQKIGKLVHAVNRGRRFTGVENPAAPRPQRPGEGRGAQIDHQIPAPAYGEAPQVQPMTGPGPLDQRQHTVDIRDGGKQRRRQCPAGDRQAGLRMALDEGADKPCRQHGIAEAVRGDKEDLQTMVSLFRRGTRGGLLVASYRRSNSPAAESCQGAA